MSKDLVAKSSTTILAPAAKVWHALIDPDAIHEYMFGTNVESGWTEGSAITWQGEWQGRPYRDKGVILKMRPGKTLQYTHFSPLAGLPDEPANYHTVTIELEEEGPSTRVTLAQDGNVSEEDRAHSEENWSMMLEGLKKIVEQG